MEVLNEIREATGCEVIMGEEKETPMFPLVNKIIKEFSYCSQKIEKEIESLVKVYQNKKNNAAN